MKINPYNSQFTIINGYDGNIMINTTNSILDFGNYTMQYENGMYILNVDKIIYQIYIAVIIIGVISFFSYQWFRLC